MPQREIETLSNLTVINLNTNNCSFLAFDYFIKIKMNLFGEILLFSFVAITFAQILNPQSTSFDEINGFSLSGFGDCVIHITRFSGETKYDDLIQNFISANPNSIWTFTNKTNKKIQFNHCQNLTKFVLLTF